LTSLSILLVAALVGVVVLFLLFAGRGPRAQGGSGEAWAQLAGLIGGDARGHKVTGSYQGRAVDVLLQNHGYEMESYVYHLTTKVRIQGFDWAASFGDTSFLNPTKGWHIKCGDEALRRRLTEAGAFELIAQAPGKPDVRYRADRGTLEYSLSVGVSSYAPTPDEFETQLNLLSRLADINEELNVW
jgi:hypothetical protein